MQDRYLCCPPCFFLGPAVPPHFFHSRIATVCVCMVAQLPALSAQEKKYWLSAEFS